jgi:GNAT superfamily N-acetyltransferase
MQVIIPSDRHYEELASIYNSAIQPYYEIYTKEEKDCFSLKETALSLQEAHKSNEIVAIQDNNSIIGYVVYYFKNKHCIWIRSLYVSPSFQRRGVGKLLLSHVEIAAKQNNISIVALETHKMASWAINFYLKHGYLNIVPNISEYPFNIVLDKPPVPNRPLLGKTIS